MANSQRRKGLEGEREVAAIFRGVGFDVRNLEGEGDILVGPGFYERGVARVGNTLVSTPPARDLLLHVEVKRQETARPWEWIKQADTEAPARAIPVVAFRRSHSKWHAIIGLEDLARLLA